MTIFLDYMCVFINLENLFEQVCLSLCSKTVILDEVEVERYFERSIFQILVHSKLSKSHATQYR